MREPGSETRCTSADVEATHARRSHPRTRREQRASPGSVSLRSVGPGLVHGARPDVLRDRADSRRLVGGKRHTRGLLDAAGLPASPPTGGDGSPFSWTVMEPLVALGGAAPRSRRDGRGPASSGGGDPVAQTSTVTAARSASKTACSTSPRSSPSACNGSGRSHTTSSRSASCTYTRPRAVARSPQRRA